MGRKFNIHGFANNITIAFGVTAETCCGSVDSSVTLGKGLVFMEWFFFAVLAHFVFTLASLVSKVLMTHAIKSSSSYAIFMSLVGLLPLLLIPIRGLEMPSFTLLVISIATGMIYIYAMLPYYKALSIEEVSRVLPLWRFIPLFVLLFSPFLVNEKLEGYQVMGFWLLVGGGYLISVKHPRSPLKVSKAFWLMILSSSMFGIHYALSKYVYTMLSYYDGFVLIRTGAFIGATLTLCGRTYRNEMIIAISAMNSKTIGLLFGQGILVLVGLALINFAMTLGPVSLITASAGFQSIFVLLFATVLSFKYPKLFQEEIRGKILLQKSAAIALIIVGSVLIAVCQH